VSSRGLCIRVQAVYGPIVCMVGQKPTGSVAGGRVARWYVFKPKIQIWVNLGIEGLGINIVGILYGHLEYDSAIWYVSFLTICKFSGHFVYFPRFGIKKRKIWQPWQVVSEMRKPSTGLRLHQTFDKCLQKMFLKMELRRSYKFEHKLTYVS
jgi:hypothetical protein